MRSGYIIKFSVGMQSYLRQYFGDTVDGIPYFQIVLYEVTSEDDVQIGANTDFYQLPAFLEILAFSPSVGLWFLSFLSLQPL